MRRLMLVGVLVLGLPACKEKPKFVGDVDAGPICEGNDHLIDGECRFVCSRDGDCGDGQRCNLFTGQCEPKPPQPDSGTPPTPCTTGAERCQADARGIERCTAEGVWQSFETCPPPTGFCQNEKCLVCQPGVASCVSGQPTQVLKCNDLGSATRTITCAGAASCASGECRECTPGTWRCSPDGKAVQQCTRTPDETQTWKWANAGDNFDGTCITGTCVAGGANGFQCEAPECFPMQARCQDLHNQQTCGTAGKWGPAMACVGATAECQGGACIDECADAIAQKSYFGCSFWTAVLDNGVDKLFKGGTTSGQGTSVSDFAFVVANRSSTPATVTITRMRGGSAETVITRTVPGRLDAATKGVATINVPWQSIGRDADNNSVSGIQRYGYKISSTKPLTVYQFNPLAAVKVQGACSSSTSCTAASNPGACVSGFCNYYAYSNDASLLLPEHILGLSYVVMGPDHILLRTGGPNSGLATDLSGNTPPFANGMVTVVATQDATQVTVKSNVRTLAGAGVAVINKGGSSTFTLNSYDVLQIASDNPANVAPAQANFSCATNPFDNSLACSLGACSTTCRTDGDLTGSVITSTKPVAAFGGSACTIFGPGQGACDHVEEQLFPFATWGKNFVATRTAPLRLTNNNFASTSEAGPDYYKVVAGCPASQCPNGTLVTLSSPGSVVELPQIPANKCQSGSLGANTCRLAGGTYVEFSSKTSFTISADQPIAVGQFFSGEDGTKPNASGVSPAQGDPSFVLLPPVEQWRSNYTVLTAPGIKDNYLGLVIDDSKVQSVQVDGATVSGFVAVTGTSTIPGASFKTLNFPVSVGTHTINIVPRPAQNPLPGAGVTVYGFDSYVSYGYTGGLDLTTIVTGINPGG